MRHTLLFTMGVSLVSVTASWLLADRAPGLDDPFLAALPPASRAAALARATEQAGSLLATVGPLPDAVRAIVAHSALRLQCLAPALPLTGLLVLSAVLLGLIVREDARAGLTHSSPLWAFVGKNAAVAAFASVFTVALSPAPVPVWVFHAASLGLAAGVGTYAANLPAKL